jgi:dipeptidase
MKKEKFLSSVKVFLCIIAFLGNYNAINACTTIIVGRNVSINGRVLLAHNEDDDLPQIVVHSKVPQKSFHSNALIMLSGGATIRQVKKTAEYFWLDLPGEPFSESGLNQWGVCLTSNNCPSREDLSNFTQGGIGPLLRQIIIERAHTAREGAQLIGKLIEKFGYQASGRTYILCDPDEAWLVCAVQGKQWLAWRVPDDEICVVANSYVVREVDFSKKNQIMASSDLIEYAINRGWYDPEKDGDFDFARVYSDPRMFTHPTNYGRQWSGLQHFTADRLEFGNHFPASIKPNKKIGVSDLIGALRDHYEGTSHYHPDSKTGDPHFGRPGTVCSPVTVSSFIVQYRNNTPRGLRFVYWACLGRPCTSCFIPFYFGIPDFPEGWQTGSQAKPDAEDWQGWVKPPFKADPLNAFATAINFRTRVCENYKNLSNEAIKRFNTIEKEALDKQSEFEKKVSRILKTDPNGAAKLLLKFSEDFYHKSLEAMKKILR